MSFYVGQEVICIDDGNYVRYRRGGWFERWRKWDRPSHNLNKGCKYTITGIKTLTCYETKTEYTCLMLAEAWHLFGMRWMPFPAFQFRPIAKRKTSIEVFTKLLTPTDRVRVKA